MAFRFTLLFFFLGNASVSYGFNFFQTANTPSSRMLELGGWMNLLVDPTEFQSGAVISWTPVTRLQGEARLGFGTQGVQTTALLKVQALRFQYFALSGFVGIHYFDTLRAEAGAAVSTRTPWFEPSLAVSAEYHIERRDWGVLWMPGVQIPFRKDQRLYVYFEFAFGMRLSRGNAGGGMRYLF